MDMLLTRGHDAYPLTGQMDCVRGCRRALYWTMLPDHLRPLRRAAVAVVTTTCSALVLGVAPAAQPDSLARREAAYAQAIATLADSAIRQLDFFPAKVQLRVQMAFLDPARSASVPFDQLAARSSTAADVVGDIGDRIDGLTPPGDLAPLHAALAESLRDARGALAQLATTAETCRGAAESVARCQAPFTSASSQLARAYKRYLATRARIGEQITDTGTILPRFAPPK
jgi:hypothetical protein